MTKEEKALAYDEALRKIRPLYERAKKEDCPIWSTYEYVFPGLAESEDERIRKALVEYHRQQFEKNRDQEIGLFHKDALTYLERQRPTAKINGEPISTENQTVNVGDDETEVQKSYREGKNAGRKEVFDNPGAYGLEKIDNVFGFRIGDKVRLVDGDGRPHIIKYFEKIEGLHGPDFYHVVFEDNTASDHIIPGDEYPNGYFTCMEKIGGQKPSIFPPGLGEVRWNPISPSSVKQKPLSTEETELNSIAFLEQIGYTCIPPGAKPAEWSEADNVGWDEAFSCVTRAESAAKSEEELQNAVTAEKWLKEIKFKYYIHPVRQEWSEEDDVMLDKVCCLINPGTKLTDDNADYCVELKQWIVSLQERILKSLREEGLNKNKEK